MLRAYAPGKLYIATLKSGFKGIVPIQRESAVRYPLESIGSIPNKSIVLFVERFKDRYDGNYLKVIYRDKIGVIARAFITLEEP